MVLFICHTVITSCDNVMCVRVLQDSVDGGSFDVCSNCAGVRNYDYSESCVQGVKVSGITAVLIFVFRVYRYPVLRLF
jgi:hypothetical protein